MIDHDIRVLGDETHYRAANNVFRRALLNGPANDEMWEVLLESYVPGRALGVFDGDEVIGSAQSFPSSLVVPGGAVLPMGAVSRVGVRADWTRRGVVSALMRTQLRSLRDMGDVAATLRATEGGIYGRFGYGVATRGRDLRVNRVKAVPRARVEGRVRVRPVSEVGDGEELRALFEEIRGGGRGGGSGEGRGEGRGEGGRPGVIGRWDGWWSMHLKREKEKDPQVVVATGPDGVDDGFAMYRVERSHTEKSELTVLDLWAGTPRAWADLWRYLLGVDLVDEVVAHLRPLDEPVELLLVDPRGCRWESTSDETWLRLIDVEEALGRREYAAGVGVGGGGDELAVVLGVRDSLLPENAGSYRVSRGGVERVEDAPEVVLDVAELAAVYLGDVSFAALAAAGRVEVVGAGVGAVGAVGGAGAVERADRLFAVGEVAWAGTYF
ncbi:GNAT family N-acetyltransferase [Actinosynnema pretiosum subsp. pretiosum]|uniref:GNAT family N-acetyltransferase n=1 Tax=Actinosynnema pretiosum subsp. pretiosum TaxID=103721 RepID=A0AA45L9H0_9PSEU|nr:GNAT family N-acetyltransferase [Actinosynnema pretiosum subsp. pretiosum]